MPDRVGRLVLGCIAGTRGSQEVDSGDKDPLCLPPFLSCVLAMGRSTQSFKWTSCASLKKLLPFYDPRLLPKGREPVHTRSQVPYSPDVYRSMTLRCISLKKETNLLKGFECSPWNKKSLLVAFPYSARSFLQGKGVCIEHIGLSGMYKTVLTIDLQTALVPQLLIFKMGIIVPNLQSC